MGQILVGNRPAEGVLIWEADCNGEPVEKFLLKILKDLPQRRDVTRWLDHLAFGRSPQAVKQIIKAQNGGGTMCGHIFKNQEPAYMCRTCGVDPTCVQCMACFKLSDHTGHDIVMIRTGEGGCCDCGDPDSWDMKGACSLHNGKNLKKAVVPDAILKKVRPIQRFVVEVVARALSGVCPLGTDAGGDMKSNNLPIRLGHVYMAYPEIIGTASEDDMHYVFLHDDSYHSFDIVIKVLTEIVLDPNSNSDQMMERKASEIASAVNGRGKTLIFAGKKERAELIKRRVHRRTDLAITIQSPSKDEMFLTHPRLSKLIAWLTDLSTLSETFRDDQCSQLLKRFASPTMPSPGVQGTQPGDWIIAQGLRDKKFNGQLGVIDGYMKRTDRRVPIRFPSNPDKKRGLKINKFRKAQKPGIPLSEGSLGSLWRFLGVDRKNGALEDLTLQLIDRVPDMAIPGSRNVFVVSDGRHMIFGDFQRCPDPPELWDIVKVSSYRLETFRGKLVIVVTSVSTVFKNFASRIGDPKSIECSAGDEARGLNPHWLSAMFKYNLSIPSNVWPDMTPWFYKLFGNGNFKQEFTVNLSTHYSDLMNEHAHLNGKVVTSFLSYNVQILTIPAMTPKVAKEYGLLRTMISTMTTQIIRSQKYLPGFRDNIPIWCELFPKPCAVAPKGVECLLQFVRTIVSVLNDIKYVVRNKGTCDYIFSEDLSLVWQYVGMLMLLENMDINKRSVNEHVTFENFTWKTAFSLEFYIDEVNFNLLRHLRTLVGTEKFPDSSASKLVQLSMWVIQFTKANATDLEDEKNLDWKTILRYPDMSGMIKTIEAKNKGDGAELLSFHFPARRMCIRFLLILLKKYPLDHPVMAPLRTRMIPYNIRCSPPVKTSWKSSSQQASSILSKQCAPNTTVEVWWEWCQMWVKAKVLSVSQSKDGTLFSVNVQYQDNTTKIHVFDRGSVNLIRSETKTLEESPAFAYGVYPMFNSVAGLCHINSSLWVRNGIVMMRQALHYSHTGSGLSGMYVADLTAFQLATCALGADASVTLMAHMHSIYWFFGLSPLQEPYALSSSKAMQDEAADEELTGIEEKKTVRSWGKKIQEVVYGFLLFFSHALTARRLVGDLTATQILEIDIVHLLIQRPRAHSMIEDRVDKETKDDNPELFEKVLRSVATLNSRSAHAVASNGQWEVKPSAAKKLFNPYWLMYKTEDRQVAESNYKIIANKLKQEKKDEKETSPYPPVVEMPPLHSSFTSLYSLYSSLVLHRILFKILAACKNSIECRSDQKAQGKECQMGEESLGLVLQIITIGLTDIKAKHLKSVPHIRKGFFQNLVVKRESLTGEKISILEILCSMMLIVRKGGGSAILKELTPLIQWILSTCYNLDESGSCAKVIGEDIGLGNKTSTKSKKLTKRQRKLAAAKARKKKIMQKMAAKRKQFIKENKEVIRKERESEDKKGDGLKSLTCIVCRTDNSNEPLGLVASLQHSSVVGIANDQKRYMEQKERVSRPGDGRSHGVQARFCGHAMHLVCRDTYYSTLVNRRINNQHYTGRNAIDLNEDEFVCPLCEAPANCLVPITSGDFKFDHIQKDLYGHFRARVRECTSSIKSKGDWEEMKDQPEFPLLDCLTYSIRSLEISYRKRRGKFPQPQKRDIVDSLKVRETMGIACLLSASASGINDKDSGEVMKLVKNMYEAASLETSKFDYIPLDVDAFRIAALSTLMDIAGVNVNGYKKNKGRQVVLTAYVIRVIQSMMHSLKEVKENSNPGLAKPIPKLLASDLKNMWFSEIDMLSYLLPFLRQLAILQHCKYYLDKLGNDVKTILKEKTTSKTELTDLYEMQLEAKTLCEKIGLPVFEELFTSSKYTLLVEYMCSWLRNKRKEQNYESMLTLKFIRSIQPPRLIRLPSAYNQIFMALGDDAKVSTSEEKKAESVEIFIPKNMRNPSLCLLTGKVVDYGKGRLSRHCEKISPNAGIFLVLRETSILLIANGYSITFGSPYVDNHGEMDINLERGHMLYMDPDRLAKLEDLIIEQKLSETVARLRMREDPEQCRRRKYY